MGLSAVDVEQHFDRYLEHMAASRWEAGERVLLDLLEIETVDSQPRRRALANLAGLYVRTARMFEALVLFRHVAKFARDAGDIESEIRAVGGACTALYGLYIGAERRDLLDRMDELLPLADSPGYVVEHAYGHLGQAIDDGDIATARHHIARMREGAKPLGPFLTRLTACVTLANEALLALMEDDPVRALRHLDELDEAGVSEPHHASELSVLRVRARVAHRDLEAAADDATAAIEALRTAPEFAISEVVLFGTQLARLLETDLNATERALVVYDVVATAVVKRIRQLDESIERLKRIGLETGFERDLARYRRIFREGQRGVLDRVGAILRDVDAEGARRVLDDAVRRDLIAICAWCESVRAADGQWKPLGHFVPRDGSYEITATICPHCREDYRRG